MQRLFVFSAGLLCRFTLSENVFANVSKRSSVDQNLIVSNAAGDTFNNLKLDTGIMLSGPLPADFMDRFAKEVAKVTGCQSDEIRVFNTSMANGVPGTNEIVWEASPDIIAAVEEQANDPHSELATGPLRLFLNTKGGVGSEATAETEHAADAGARKRHKGKGEKSRKGTSHAGRGHDGKDSDAQDGKDEKDGEDRDGLKASRGKVLTRGGGYEEVDNEVQEKGIDVDSEMPYGEIEPFGREDTAQELTRASIKESDEMVDQIERAEVAEEKRAVFRALTRLRGAAITSFDGVARAHTGNIDSYARDNHWRSVHPVRHLAHEEGDVDKWAFPTESDF